MGIFIRVSLYTSVCADLHIQRDCVCVYACVRVWTCIHCMCVHLCVRLCMHVVVCVHGCIYVEVGACVRVCV